MPIGRNLPQLNESDVLAAREYTLQSQIDCSPRIVVRIGYPTKGDDGYYICVAEIIHGNVVSTKPMSGVDAFEALQLALSIIEIELEDIRNQSQGQLSWNGGERFDLGFPLDAES